MLYHWATETEPLITHVLPSYSAGTASDPDHHFKEKNGPTVIN